jgi:hypothetical protein
MADVVTKSTPTGKQFLAFTESFNETPPLTQYVTRSWTNSRSGTSFPRWRAKVKAHENATTTMTANKIEIEATPGFFYAKTKFPNGNPLSTGQFQGMSCGLPSTTNFLSTDIFSGSAANDAAGVWYSKVRNKMASMKGLVFAGESPEAKRMMFDRASKMIAMIDPHQRRLKKRWRGKGSKRAKLKLLSDSWLELQFGWLPLASDIEDAYHTLQNPVPMFKRVKAYGNYGYALPCSPTSVQGSGINRIEGTVSETHFTQVKFYGEIVARTTNQVEPLQDFGLGVREFLPTLYEILPWSFAFDYFTNIGTIVSSLSYATVVNNWVAQDVIRQKQRKATATGDAFVQNGQTKEVFVNISSSYSMTASDITRSPVTNVPIPSLSFKLPNMWQVLNLTALAASRRLRLFL